MKREIKLREGGCAFFLVIVMLIVALFGLFNASETETEPAPQPKQVEVTTTTTTAPTTATTTPTEPAPEGEPYYALTDWERDLVERVVMAEAGGEEFDGQIAVAQCILNASELRGIRPSEAVVELKYTKARPEPTESVKQAVAAVFDDGYRLFDREVIYFYAPALVTSTWHESQTYVTTIGCHKFFKEAR